MKILKRLEVALDYLLKPIRFNTSFFFFMYVAGIVLSYIELPDKRDAQIYDNLWLELFLDLYVVCLLLTIIPKKIRRWVRGVFYFIIYATSIADVFCWEKFKSALTPTMLLLVGETDGREASEFLNSYLTPDLIFSGVGFLILIILIQFFLKLWPYIRIHLPRAIRIPARESLPKLRRLKPAAAIAVLVLLVWSLCTSFENKHLMARMFSNNTIGGIEHELTKKEHANFYLPVYRLAFSIFSNELASQQVAKLIEAKDKVTVDSCSYTTPNIVLIIGESYGRLHSQQYGYFMPTTPRQKRLERSGLLVRFRDVVSCWNLTSFVFKNIFSLHVVGEKGEWCDYPLFPELFRKAGYHVSFITNQFLPKAGEAVYDFSGGFFLNHPELSEAMFDTRNNHLYRYDSGLISCYDNQLKKENTDHNLIIFHLIGQHVGYRQRCPNDRRHFKADDYEEHRPELSNEQRRVLADYDNAVLYNDSIVHEIVKRFEDKNAVVIYMPDHGEECYEGTRGFICRNHSMAIDYPLARYEFEIPFWIYCSHKFCVARPDIYKQVLEARNRRYMTDALPHLLLYLAGIHSPYYHSEYNVLSDDYNEKRPRLLKNSADYDKLRDEYNAR